MYTYIMQPIKKLAQVLKGLADEEHYLFTLADLKGALPGHSPGAFRALVSRAEKDGLLRRVCRGLYLYPGTNYTNGLVLYHAAARLRAHEFNYISLESALSDASVISQIPMNWVTLMSSGRSQVMECGDFGTIEFTHTKNENDLLLVRPISAVVNVTKEVSALGNTIAPSEIVTPPLGVPSL